MSSSYSPLLSLGPADWLPGGDPEEDDMAAAVSGYLSFDADELYYYHPPVPAAFRSERDEWQQAEVVSGEAGSNGFSGEASEQSHQTDASVTLAGPPAGHAAALDTFNEGSSASGGTTAGRKGKIAFKTRSEVDVLDDGYRWRKYGKKMVKNSPNPRNYYRCSSEGCHVKKRVERERDDARFVITTYDGVHNHPAAPRAYLRSGTT